MKNDVSTSIYRSMLCGGKVQIKSGISKSAELFFKEARWCIVTMVNICANGPAIWGGCVTRRSIRQLSWYPAPAGPRNCPGARRVWRTFCSPGTNFIEHYECRDTRLIGAASLSPITKFVAGTSAVSRYNLSRSQKSIKMQDFNCVLMRACPDRALRESGCPGATVITNLS